jgi:hypothetical protein
MFEFHLGKGLTLSSEELKAPLLLLGRSGQGKSTFLMQFVLELIKNKQSGLLYDPYGDLTLSIQKHLQSEEAKSFVQVLNQDEDLPGFDGSKFLLVSGNLMEEGTRITAKKAQAFLKAYVSLKSDGWLIVDEAFDLMDEELFDFYVNREGKQKILLSAEELVGLSKIERERLLRVVQSIVAYKTRKLCAKWLSEYQPVFKTKDMEAIKQYHFQYSMGDQFGYDSVRWPLEDI